MKRFVGFLGASAVVLGLLIGSSDASAQFNGSGGMYFGSLNARPAAKPSRNYASPDQPLWIGKRSARRAARRTVAAGRKTAREADAVEASKPFSKEARNAAVETGSDVKADATTARSEKNPIQLVVSIPDQRVAVYRGNEVIATSRVSTGRSGYSTPSGVFSIIGKERMHYSNLYESAPMPWMQRITWSGVALHAGNVSRPYASHGCVRLPYGFAQSLYKRTNMGAHVVIAAGMSTPEVIDSDVLPQPLPPMTVTAVENVSTSTSAQPGSGMGAEEPADVETGGVPNFIPPVEAANDRLEAAKQARDEAEANVPNLETGLDAARDVARRQKSTYEAAQDLVGPQLRELKAAQRDVAKARRPLAAERRNLAKLEGRAKWSQATIDKRVGDPRFEGDWMTTALARLAQRKALVAEAEEKTAAAQKVYDVAEAVRVAAADALKQARAKAAAEQENLAEADGNVRQAETELKRGKAAVTQAEAAVRKATADLRASQRREKMPLRVVITPLIDAERIKLSQRLLMELGYEGVEPVGWVGRKTAAAIRTVEREMDRPVTGKVSEALIDELYRRVGRAHTSNAHMYVRQGFLDLFDLPVIIKDPEQPLGTHVFTAMHFEDVDTSVDWTALTVKERGTVVRRKGKRVQAVAVPEISAKEVLARISIPDYARRQLSSMLTPGSSIVVTDKGISHETGKGTDFVVLTK